MRKSRAAVVGTVGTVMIGAGWAAGLIATAASAESSGLSLVADATTDSTTTSPSASASESPTASASASESATPSASATPSETATTDTSTQAAPAETAPAGVTGTYTGATVQTRYGNYQVSLSISDGVITAVNILQDGDTDRESMQIKSRSEPTIISRVLEAQSYNVSGVSGASYTSQGILLSVQSAMQSAGLA